MQNLEKQTNSEASQSQSENINNKQKISVINRNPSIDILKKMFFRTKNRSQHLPKQQSLLFDRNNSLAMLKAYRNRKKIIIDQTIVKGKQYEIDKFSNNKSTIDSPQKINFCLQSEKYQFDSNDMNQRLYNQIFQKIQDLNSLDPIKLPSILSNSPNKIKKSVKSQNQSVQINKKPLPSLYEFKDQSTKNNISIDVTKTIEPTQNYYANRKQFYRVKQFKNVNAEKQGILLMKGALRQSLQNPPTSITSANDNSKGMYGTFSQCKLKKQAQAISNPSVLPQLKVVKSVSSLISQTPKIHKGYMHFHLEAKLFLKKHKQNLNETPKIKQLLISGITASNYAVIDMQTMIPVAAKGFMKKIQIASISKIMTCYLSLLVCKKYGIDSKKCQVKITLQASQMKGTSAELQIGDCLTLQDLFYALMLPSGNDAAIAIAETIGKIIQRHKKKQTKKSYYETFIAHMNLISKQLKLQQQWKNSHGLPLNPNHSTPQAICLLTVAAMMNDKFKQIVSCKQYEATIRNERTGLKKYFKWKNTNKLLDDGWEGVKTGTTDTAGHCLMAKKDRYLIAVFDSKTLTKRFTECSQLYELVKSKQRFLYPQKWD